jgi:TRAP-type C4-dicarboxylate transport system permease large subunit
VKPDCDLNAAPAPVVRDADDDLLDDLFGEEEEGASEEAVAAAKAVCQEKFDKYEAIVARQNDSGLQSFVAFEQAVGSIATNSVGFGKHFLVLGFILCGSAVTIQRQHLGLRMPRTPKQDRISQAVQLVGNLIVVCSFWAYYQQDLASGVEVVSNLPIFWMIGFGAMALCNLILILRPLAPPEPEIKDSIGASLLGIPLYAYMALICGMYFAFIEQHFAGVAIYLNQMTEHADLYTNVALYVFSGMMLKYTNIADKFFALLRPWKLSPELLAFFIVLLSAIPTAYSGASGIFVLAAGALIYREMKKAQARDSLALAATAMSGSMGIVLSPCLLVVIIAALNKSVTTGELFHAGLAVFGVNIFVFAIALFATRREKLHCENPILALPGMGKAFLPFLPYLLIGAAVLLALRYGLGAAFDEYSAPYLLPFVLLVLLIFDRIMAKRKYAKDFQKAEDEGKDAPAPVDGIWRSLSNAVNSTSVASGGLLSLMTMSICVGGIIERSNLNELLPQQFGSPILAMGMLFIILVFIGMIMDPYGAVILVSATLAKIAEVNGIAPVHFWVTVLCAFELGYLTPPVALNQLLTRQVVGDKAFDYERSEDRPKKFWLRHERLLLPLAVKCFVLLIVAFMPLIVNIFRWQMKG